MPYFADADELYHHLGGLLDDVMRDDQLGPRFRGAGIVLQYACRAPQAVITIAMREPGRVDLGPTELAPDVVMSMDADVAHRFFLGKVNPTRALAQGQIRARGPVAKVLKLLPLVRPLFDRYRTRLESAGRADLLDV